MRLPRSNRARYCAGVLWRLANACTVWGDSKRGRADSVGICLPAQPDSQHPSPAAIFAWEEGIRRRADLAFLSQDYGHTDVQPAITHDPSDHAATEIEPACVYRPGGKRGVW